MQRNTSSLLLTLLLYACGGPPAALGPNGPGVDAGGADLAARDAGPVSPLADAAAPPAPPKACWARSSATSIGALYAHKGEPTICLTRDPGADDMCFALDEVAGVFSIVEGRVELSGRGTGIRATKDTVEVLPISPILPKAVPIVIKPGFSHPAGVGSYDQNRSELIAALSPDGSQLAIVEATLRPGKKPKTDGAYWVWVTTFDVKNKKRIGRVAIPDSVVATVRADWRLAWFEGRVHFRAIRGPHNDAHDIVLDPIRGGVVDLGKTEFIEQAPGAIIVGTLRDGGERAGSELSKYDLGTLKKAGTLNLGGPLQRREGSAHNVYFDAARLSDTELWVGTVNPPAITRVDVKALRVVRSHEVPGCDAVRP